MTNRSIARIVLRVWGLVWILSAAGTLLQVVTLVLRPAAPGGAAGYFKTAFVSIAMSGLVAPAILILGSGRLASWLFPSEEPVKIDSPAGALAPVLFAAVGVSFALYALPDLVNAALPGGPPMPRRFSAPRGGEVLPFAVQFAAGLALFLGSGPLGRLWNRLQERNSNEET